ncbi:MAG: hypothetical protein AAF823_11555, partial [Planctomycetota bacterium]
AHQHANSAQWFTDNGGPVYSPPGFGLDHELDTTRNVLRQAADDQTPRVASRQNSTGPSTCATTHTSETPQPPKTRPAKP